MAYMDSITFQQIKVTEKSKIHHKQASCNKNKDLERQNEANYVHDIINTDYCIRGNKKSYKENFSAGINMHCCSQAVLTSKENCKYEKLNLHDFNSIDLLSCSKLQLENCKNESLLNFGLDLENSINLSSLSETDYSSSVDRLSDITGQKSSINYINTIESRPSLDANSQNTESSRTQGLTISLQSHKEFSRAPEETKKSAVDKLRQSYLAKLEKKSTHNKSVGSKAHNSIIIFDWDDTLLCTTYLKISGIIDIEDDKLSISSDVKEKLNNLDKTVTQILTEAINLSDTYIITNSEPGWVEYSAKRFYPETFKLLSSIKIVSARGEFEKRFPGDNKQWKVQAFLDMLKTVNINLVTNLICLGDSSIEMEAAHILASKFSQAFIKTVKFKESPKPSELNKQLKMVKDQFSKIYTTVKNLSIRVEKKGK